MESRCGSLQPSRLPGMAKGFTLYMLKAVISGRDDELVNLVKTICGANEDWPWPHTASWCECPNLGERDQRPAP